LASGFHNLVTILSQRNFAISTTGYGPALTGLWAQRVGVGWLAWSLTHSPTWLGIVAAADLVPTIVLSPIAGAIIDRVHPLRMTIISQAVMVAQSTALWLLTAFGIIDVYSLFALAVLLGINNPFTTAARMNLLPMMVTTADFPAAIGVNSMLFNLSRILGPTFAGTLIAISGVDIVFLLNGVAQFGFLASSMMLHLPKESPGLHKGRGGLQGLIDDVHEGFAYAFRHPGIGPLLLLMVLTAVTSRPAADMLPGFADQIFHRGATGLGWLGSAIGFGGVIGAIWLTQRGGIAGLTRVIVLNALVVGVALVGFAQVRNFWAALAFLAVAGFSMVVSGAGTQTLLQSSVDNAMRGRVMALFSLLYRGMPAAGSLFLGLAAEAIGLIASITIAACLCIASWWWTHRREDGIRTALESNPTGADHKPH
jgi:MFS family permease